MVNRVQTLRSSVAGNVPTSGTRQPGELWLNFTDKQIGYIDQSQVAQKLQAVRFFSALTSYAVGDCVWNAGVLYSASVAVVPGAFNPLQWTLIGGAGTGFLPLSGGTLTGSLALSTGSLSVSAGNISASGSGTFGSVTTATATVNGALTMNGNINAGSYTGVFKDLQSQTLEVSGLAGFSGNMNVSGNLNAGTLVTAGAASVGGNMSVTGTCYVNSTLASNGPGALIVAYDRQGSGQYMQMYRTGGAGLIGMSDYGNHLSLNNNGTLTINVNFTGAGSFVSNGPVSIYGDTAIASSTCLNLHSNGNNYPLLMDTPSSQHCLASYYVAGARQWLAGCWNSGSFWIYDASGQAARLTIDTGGYVAIPSPGRLTSGANGLWQAQNGAEFSPSPVTGNVGGMASYGGTYSGGWSIYARTDAWTNYNMLILQGTTANGSITSNGSNAFFNTSCDARLKENIRPLASEIRVGEDIIDKLNPVAFEWLPVEFMTLGEPAVEDVTLADGTFIKGKPAVEGKPVRIEAHTDHGFIAQDLYQVLPGIVHKPEKDDLPMMADYSKMVPYLVAELQALRKRVAQLEAA